MLRIKRKDRQEREESERGKCAGDFGRLVAD
jgi:hypothetical protein